MDTLTKLVRDKRKLETRVTNQNKKDIINTINKHSKDFGYLPLNKNASASEVARFKSEYVDNLTYKIVSLAVNQGKDIIAEIEGRDLKKSKDIETRRLGDFAKDLARAKNESDRKLTKEQKEFIERGNNHIKGYGVDSMINLFEKAKNPKEIKEVIEQIKKQDPKQVFHNKQTDLIDTVFQRVGVFKEEELNKLKERFKNMSFEDAQAHTNYLLTSLELYDSDKQVSNGTETELLEARLSDMLIKTGVKSSGVKKVQKVFDKYKKVYDKRSGFIYE